MTQGTYTVSQQKPALIKAQTGLEAENEMLRSALEHFPGGIIVYDASLHMVFCSSGVRDLLELPEYLFEFGPPSLEQMFRFNAIRGEYGQGDVEEQVQTRMKLAAKREPHKYRRVRPNGKIIEVRGAPLENGGFVTAYIEIDARENRDENRNNPSPKTVFDAAMDWASFHEQSNALLKRASPHTISALHFIDINDYNGTLARYGETAARVLINGLAHRMARAINTSDKLVFLGDDEFAVLQYDIMRPSAVAKLEAKLIAVAREPISLGSAQVSPTISIGVAMAPRDGHDIDTLMAKARVSMRRGRQEGAPHHEEALQ